MLLHQEFLLNVHSMSKLNELSFDQEFIISEFDRGIRISVLELWTNSNRINVMSILNFTPFIQEWQGAFAVMGY